MFKKAFLLIFFLKFFLFLFTNENSVDQLFQLNENLENYDFLSDLELEIIKELNIARTNPKQYAEYLKEYKKCYDGFYLNLPDRVKIITEEGVKAVDDAINFLSSCKPLKPLKISKGLYFAARDHVKDIGEKGKTGHRGSDGSSPFDRMNRYGKWGIYAGENIDYGNDIPRHILFSLIIDDGVPSRGHRNNIFNEKFMVIGVAFGKHKVYNWICVMEFSGKYEEEMVSD